MQEPPATGKVWLGLQWLRNAVWKWASGSEVPQVNLRCFCRRGRGSHISMAPSLRGVSLHTYVKETQVCLSQRSTAYMKNFSRTCGSTPWVPLYLPDPVLSPPQHQSGPRETAGNFSIFFKLLVREGAQQQADICLNLVFKFSLSQQVPFLTGSVYL